MLNVKALQSFYIELNNGLQLPTICRINNVPDYEFHCTLKQSKKIWKEGRHNLDIIAARCGYALSNHHHALADAEACAAIALKIL